MMGTSTAAPWGAKVALKVMRTGEIPATRSPAATAKRYIRGFIKRHDSRIGSGSLLHLSYLADQCEQAEREMSIKQQTAAVDAAEDAAQPGVYVYTLPHYLNNPMKPAESDFSNDRTLFEVGMSSGDVHQRIQQQVNTGLPEPPMLLRVYECDADEAADMESIFHRILSAFDHDPLRHRGAGKEWFMTSLVALDELADVLGLNTVDYYDEDEEDEEEYE